MSTQEESEVKVSAKIENIGGIEEETLNLEPGTNLLAGPNSTNKTSTLQAISLALGSTEPQLKSDAIEGKVTLKIDDEKYTRSLQRKNDSVHIDGDPYLEESDAAENFAFLFESNKARLAVEKEGNLRDVVMDAVDTDEIQSQIKELTEERDRLQERIREIEDKRKDLEDLRRRRKSLKDEIGKKRKNLSEIEQNIRQTEGDVSDIKERRNRLNNLIEERSSLEKEIESLDSRLESERQSIDLKKRHPIVTQ